MLALLAFVLVAHPAVMAVAHHGHLTPSVDGSHAERMQLCAADTCVQAMLRLRAAIAQAAPRLPIPPIIVLALMALLYLAWRKPPVPVRRNGDWCWPFGRRRALLQVFLI